MSDKTTNSNRPLIRVTACLSLAVLSYSVQADTGYLTNSAGEPLTTSSNECWRIADGLAPTQA